MSEGLDLDVVRRAVQGRRMDWQRHALERMSERHILRAHVLTVLISGECIEHYPELRPFPAALMLGWVGARPLHVVVALDAEREYAFVITVYEPDLNHFENDFRTRRPRL